MGDGWLIAPLGHQGTENIVTSCEVKASDKLALQAGKIVQVFIHCFKEL